MTVLQSNDWYVTFVFMCPYSPNPCRSDQADGILWRTSCSSLASHLVSDRFVLIDHERIQHSLDASVPHLAILPRDPGNHCQLDTLPARRDGMRALRISRHFAHYIVSPTVRSAQDEAGGDVSGSTMLATSDSRADFRLVYQRLDSRLHFNRLVYCMHSHVVPLQDKE